MAKCEEAKDGDTLWRTLTLKDGGVIKEKMTTSSATSYAYAITESPLPVKDYTASFSAIAKADAPDTTIVSWTANFQANGKPEAEVKDIIKGIFTGGLDNIKTTIAK